MDNNLKTFRILYIIKGILTLMIAFFFLAYAFLGVYLMGRAEFSDNSIDFNPGIIIFIIGIVGILFSLLFGVLTLLAAKYLKEVKNFNFIFIVAILNCLTGVLGILLGIFTIIELQKPGVKALFNKEKTLI